MFGSFMMQEINKSKYDILASGPRLQFEAMYLSSEVRAAKKSKVVLEHFFWNNSINAQEGSLTFRLMVLIAQKRAEFLNRTFISNLKLIGDVYD